MVSSAKQIFIQYLESLEKRPRELENTIAELKKPTIKIPTTEENFTRISVLLTYLFCTHTELLTARNRAVTEQFTQSYFEALNMKSPRKKP